MYNYNEALICITPSKKEGAARDDHLRSLSKYADGLDCYIENSENRSPNVPSFPSLTPTGTHTPFQMLDGTNVSMDFNEQDACPAISAMVFLMAGKAC